MIIFNNRDLEEIAPVKIEDITVSPIQLNPYVRPRPVQFGSEFVRMGGGTRTVTISFALLESAINERESMLQDVRDWAYSTTEKTLQLPMFPNRHLECILTQFPDHNYRKWWENKLKMVFTCYNNPYWTSNEQIEVAPGTTFTVGGSAPPLMTIVRSASTSLTNVTFATRTESMTFTTIPSGNLTINLNRQTAQIGNSSIMQYYRPSSTWLVPRVGADQYFSGVGVLRFRERWV